MRSTAQLTKWLLENRSKVNPRFTEFSWPERYFRGLHDFEARIIVRDVKCNGTGESRTIEAYGRGIDFDQELAVEKASSEAIERLICMSVKIGSKGVAVAGRNGADEHAKNEALERYYFTMQETRGFPFEKIESAIAKQFAEKFAAQNQYNELRFYRMAIDGSINGIVCAIGKNPDDPKFLGIALDRDQDYAITRSMCEALANFAKHSDDPVAYKAKVCVNDDLWICRDLFLNNIGSLFCGHSIDRSILPAKYLFIPEPILRREPIDISKFEALRGCPISPVRYIALVPSYLEKFYDQRTS